MASNHATKGHNEATQTDQSGQTPGKSPAKQVGVRWQESDVEQGFYDRPQSASGASQSTLEKSQSASETWESNLPLGTGKDKRDRKFKHRRHSLWYLLRHRHISTGVIVLDPRHPLMPRLVALTTGIRELLTAEDTPGPKDQLAIEDYQSVIQKQVQPESYQGCFVFESFATSVFATIRRAVDVKEHLYLKSLATPDTSFLEFISNSRSGQEFFLSHDMRYLIKTNKERDIKFLISVLGEYLQHFLSFPHSLLVKYLGCYAVQAPGKKKKYFLIMQNIFYPPDRIEDRFDVKGCTAGRYQEPSPPGTNVITILKDQNFFQEEIELGIQSQWFIDQIKADATFLRNLNVMDYSLLVGRQHLRSDERLENQRLPDIVCRVTKSYRTYSSSSGRDSRVTPASDLSPRELANESLFPPHSDSVGSRDSIIENLPGAVEVRSAGMVLPQIKRGLHFPRSLAQVNDHFADSRRRLLPDCPNALHVIDGPNYRYFFGIVDFLTHYTWKQKIARLWKVIKYGCGEHSTMPPDYYSKRFVTFLANRVR